MSFGQFDAWSKCTISWRALQTNSLFSIHSTIPSLILSTNPIATADPFREGSNPNGGGAPLDVKKNDGRLLTSLNCHWNEFAIRKLKYWHVFPLIFIYTKEDDIPQGSVFNESKLYSRHMVWKVSIGVQRDGISINWKCFQFIRHTFVLVHWMRNTVL